MDETEIIPMNERCPLSTAEATREDSNSNSNSNSNSKAANSVLSRLMSVEGNADSAAVPDDGAVKEFFKSFVIDFLRSMSYSNTPEDCTTDAREVEEIAAAVAKLCHPSVTEKLIKCGTLFGVLCLKYHPLEYKIKYAHYCAMTLAIDDFSQRSAGNSSSDSASSMESWHEDMRVFHLRMCDPEGFKKLYPGRESLHPVLEDFITYLRTEQNPFFPKHPILHSQFIKGNLDFIASTHMENCYDSLFETESRRLPDMILFTNFLRQKTSAAEPFSLFVGVTLADDQRLWLSHIFPMVPEIIQFMQYTNDIVSLFKEVMAGEDMSNSTIFNLAKVDHSTPLQALQKVSSLNSNVCHRIAALCDNSGSVELKKVTLQLLQGFTTWHIALNRRYRMKEVLGDWFQGVYW